MDSNLAKLVADIVKTEPFSKGYIVSEGAETVMIQGRGAATIVLAKNSVPLGGKADYLGLIPINTTKLKFY